MFESNQREARNEQSPTVQDLKHEMWANVTDLESKMTTELIEIEEKRDNLVKEMLPKDSYGKGEYAARVYEQTFEGIPLKHMIAIWTFDQLKFDLGEP